MTKSKINFSVDRTSVKEGESVLVAWECGIPDAVTLTINNGYSTSQIQLADSGSRAVTMTKSKGRTTLRLTVATAGRIERREIEIRVKNQKITRTYSSPRRRRTASGSSAASGGGIKVWWERVRYRFRSFVERLRYSWQVMPPKTKRLYKWMLLLLAAMWIGSLSQGRGYKAGYEQGFEDAKQMLQQPSTGAEI
ncbi:MAG: hypothetical protein J6V28_04980 [Tidjanibacter sp.]|nr:hypothetical protein [Tidjanibacter sp.]